MLAGNLSLAISLKFKLHEQKILCRSVSGSMLAVSGGDNKVSLWKETLEEQWVCISEVNKGSGVTA
jgi:hypothetical protein